MHRANESRPAGNGAAITNQADGPTGSILPQQCPRCLQYYRSGYMTGVETGRQQMDDELATIQRTAAEVVHKMAGLDSWEDHAAKVRQSQQEAGERFRSACAAIREREASA